EIMNGSGTSYQKFGNVYRRFVVPRVIKKSRRIITVSEYEKKRIGEFFRISEDPRLVSVYNGVGEHFQPVSRVWELTRIRDKYRLPAEFFFYFGNTDPKKNTPRVISAFSDFIRITGKKMYLVMVDFDRQELERIIDEIHDPELLNRIILTGYVKNSDLPGIYSLCQVFLYPSLRESFGIPIVEAMACGAPVITSNTSSMPEIAGEAAVLIDPLKTEELVDAMIRLSGDANLRAGYREAGFIQAAKFSWRSMTKNVLDIYSRVYTETHPS
ncbi:MAG: glycosyltransferase family 4 protein, partial [Syntrophothermus sp.]